MFKNNDLEQLINAHAGVAVIRYMVIAWVLCIGEPDLLDAIIHVINSIPRMFGG